MAGAVVSWRGKEFNRRVIRAANAGLEAAAMSFSETARRSFGSNHGGRPSDPGKPPNTQSGNLRRRIAWVGPKAMGDLRAAFGTDVKYGRHLEFGAKIVAKRSKFLTIPITYEGTKLLRRFGSCRKIPKLVWSPVEGIVLKPAERVISSKGKGKKKLPKGFGGFLGFRKGRGKKKEFHGLFILVKSAAFHARPWLRPSVPAGKVKAVAAFQAAARRAARPA